jgi:uncharacterized protein involved in response to NO
MVIARTRPWAGPAIFSYGFRPFFLLGALYSGIAIVTWLPMFYGELAAATAFAPLDWHVHEMIYGFVPAVLTGFLLTAIPNWTGRLPIQGAPLIGLVAVWLAGRAAVTSSAVIGWAPAAAIDAAFLLFVAAAAAREIVAGRNWRNLPVVVLVAGFAAGNVAFHLEAHSSGGAGANAAARFGIAVAAILISLVGGRLIPSFTHNWLVRENPGRLPVPFGRFDVVVVAASAVALAAWIVSPATTTVGLLLIAASGLQSVRLARWAGDSTIHDRLVLILHVGYAFVPLGLLLAGLAAFDLVAQAAGIHAFAGEIGIMTLAVMTRATLGHTGRRLEASPSTQAIYAAVILAAVARVCAALHPAWSPPLLHVGAFAWAAAFVGFAAAFGPFLIGNSVAAKPA